MKLLTTVLASFHTQLWASLQSAGCVAVSEPERMTGKLLPVAYQINGWSSNVKYGGWFIATGDLYGFLRDYTILRNHQIDRNKDLGGLLTAGNMGRLLIFTGKMVNIYHDLGQSFPVPLKQFVESWNSKSQKESIQRIPKERTHSKSQSATTKDSPNTPRVGRAQHGLQQLGLLWASNPQDSETWKLLQSVNRNDMLKRPDLVNSHPLCGCEDLNS